MILQQFYLNCLAHASYVIGDEETGVAAVVDPQRDIDDLGCITHLEIQFCHDVLTEAFQIPVLNVAAIAA